MINLLPPVAIEEISRQYRKRKLIVGGFLIFALVIIAVINLASLLAVLRVEAADLKTKLAAAETKAEASGAAELEKETAKLNQKLRLIIKSQTGKYPGGVWLAQVLDHGVSGIVFQTLAYARTESGVTLKLQGLAATRQKLLDLVASLRQNPNFVSVDSPVSNLIKDRDVTFTLEIKVHD